MNFTYHQWMHYIWHFQLWFGFCRSKLIENIKVKEDFFLLSGLYRFFACSCAFLLLFLFVFGIGFKRIFSFFDPSTTSPSCWPLFLWDKHGLFRALFLFVGLMEIWPCFPSDLISVFGFRHIERPYHAL